MNELISPSALIGNSSFLPVIEKKQNKDPDSIMTMDQSRRCVNTYHVEQGKVYFPFYKTTNDGKTQNKSVHFDLDELRKFLKDNIDTNSTRDIEPIPDKCINQGSPAVSIITPILKIYPTESASQSGELTTNMTREPTIILSTEGGIAESAQNKT
ncbi:hypothetical protein [Endozoicomonas sp. ONNA2]|uniref:hypothetical protein n=1 Tax=Endozoicomonas sp. ONNA2 TaxID=2828741 RepID=UPI00214970D0|nr:hypothetical protein [Endozoicomonas sp. ONNA2]